MFRVNDPASLQQMAEASEKNYAIHPNDYLKVDIYTNKGERIIDPDLKLNEQNSAQNALPRPEIKYLVGVNGAAKLPLVGVLPLAGLTLREAEQMLQKEYAKFYTEPYVTVACLNKRVIVLGTPEGMVVPLENENTRLAEILALSKAVTTSAKAGNIRVIRQDQVYKTDFTTIEGYRQGNMIMESGDIVYVEPERRVLREAARDYGPFITVLGSFITLVAVLVK